MKEKANMKHQARRAQILGVTAVAALSLTLAACVSSSPSPARPSPGTLTNGPQGLVGADLHTIQEALQSGSVTSEQLVGAYIDRIEAYDSAYGDQPGLSAVTELNAHAIDEAREKDAARRNGVTGGALFGIPVLVKDIVSVKGMSTPVSDGDRPLIATEDATVVTKLRDAGAIVLAHTRTGEGATNPYDQTKHPGGSSSGNGAGIAAGFAPVAVGEDTGGSIRYPAAWTSTIGLRTTQGLVSMQGVQAGTLWADTLGPQSDSVAGLAAVMDVIAGHDPSFPGSIEGPAPESYSQFLDEGYLKGKTIGILQPLRQAADQEVIAGFDEAAAVFEKAGAKLVSINTQLTSNPGVAEKNGTEMLLETPGGYSAGYSTPDKRDAQNAYLNSLGADTSALAKLAEPKDRLTAEDLAAADGDPAPTSDPEASARLKAQREALRAWYAGIVAENGVDFVIYPPTRTLPVDASLPPGTYKPNNEFLATFLGYPAVSVPAGFVKGLPFGIEILGTAPFQDAEVLGAGFAFEQLAAVRSTPGSVPALKGESELFTK